MTIGFRANILLSLSLQKLRGTVDDTTCDFIGS